MASKQYLAQEASLTFKSTGGDAAFTPTSLGNNAGRQSAWVDRGAGSRADRYAWEAKTRISSTTSVAVGNVLSVYLVTSRDGTNADGALANSDAALPAADRRRNLRFLGVVTIDQLATGVDFIASGVCVVPERYVGVVFYNEFGNSLSATAGDHQFTLTPVPPEMQ